MIAISASARITVTRMPPMGAPRFGGGLLVSKSGTLLGRTLLIAPSNSRSGQCDFERTRGRALDLSHEIVIVEWFLDHPSRLLRIVVVHQRAVGAHHDHRDL